MFCYYYNYLFFFFGYELLVLICFLFFLLFADIAATRHSVAGALLEAPRASGLQLALALNSRRDTIHQLELFAARWSNYMSKILIKFCRASAYMPACLQAAAKKLSVSYLETQVRCFLAGVAACARHRELVALRAAIAPFGMPLGIRGRPLMPARTAQVVGLRRLRAA